MPKPKKKKKRPDLLFSDKDLLQYRYRKAFLDFTEKLAPEVLATVRELHKAYQALTGGYVSPAFDGWLKGEIPDGARRDVLDEILAGRPDLPEDAAWTAAADLRGRFSAFIENYGLTADWLKEGIVRGLGRPVGFPGLAVILSDAWFPACGEDLALRVEGWVICESWKEFEDRARKAFELSLDRYRTETIQHFRGLGYKEKQDRAFADVKWLVHWTVMRTDRDTILKLIKKEKPSTRTIEDLKDAFRGLAKAFGLPNRRSTRRRGKDGGTRVRKQGGKSTAKKQG